MDVLRLIVIPGATDQVTESTRDNDAYAFTYANRSRGYVPNGLNQYASVGGAAFGYESSGSLAGDPGTATASPGAVSVGYDAENRLIAVFGARSTSLAYDPLGRLWSAAGGKRFLYDGDALVAEYGGSGALEARSRSLHQMSARHSFAGRKTEVRVIAAAHLQTCSQSLCAAVGGVERRLANYCGPRRESFRPSQAGSKPSLWYGSKWRFPVGPPFFAYRGAHCRGRT